LELLTTFQASTIQVQIALLAGGCDLPALAYSTPSECFHALCFWIFCL